MVTVTTAVDIRTGAALKAINERQSAEELDAMLVEWTSEEIAEHFKEHYKLIEANATDNYILDEILDMFEENELESMIRYHRIANVIECAKVAGYLTEIDGFYAMSITYPKEV